MRVGVSGWVGVRVGVSGWVGVKGWAKWVGGLFLS